ncbi:hypothetical protein [Couchioplanes caeruleus]|uniref:Uncharacterized protein n=2 Tax=Couchioplanes caeruleus TaxID=56438 RepID=A0A1K0GDR8_9ACTN|nr:hypothetical protein [Couchioplanes caeruleus]OJF15378.1 hypothetical protein BG844_04565 [Couchioplanes caeruleus subsp. caeruleus]ROP33416.1 hypothetical protein EDD30_6395 [Couchioplanes caeruleus]
MSAEIWHLAITDGGIVADGVIGQFDTATEAARTASIVLHRVAARLRAWAATADRGDPRAGRAREIAGRLVREAAEIFAADTEHAVAEVLDDPNLAAIPLNTLALHHDFRLERTAFCDAPIPFSGRWSRQALWLQTWTTTWRDEPDPSCPRRRPAQAARRHLHNPARSTP